MSARRERIAATLGYLALAALLAPRAAVGQATFWHHDFRHHHDPWRAWAATRWAAGEVPWWTPGAANGFPLLAEGEGGFLYPPTMVAYLALPDGLALSWAVLGHLVWAALGLFLYLRARALPWHAAWIGGLCWGASGFLVSHAMYLGMLSAASWLGWALWAGATRRPAVLALAVGLMGLAGHPQAAAFGGLLLAVHAVGQRFGAWWWAAVAVGVGIASPQLVATLQLARESARDGGVDAAFANIGALNPIEWVRALLPYTFGFDRPADVPLSYHHRGDGYWGPSPNSWEASFYIGIVPFVLALCGARRRPAWVLVALAGVVLALGGPPWALLRMVPGFDGFRFPVRFAMWTALAVSVLAAHGVAALRRPVLSEAAARATTLALVLGSLAFGLVYGASHLAEAPLLERLASALAARAARPPPPAPSSALARAALPPPTPADPAAAGARAARILTDLRRSTSPASPRTLIPLGLLALAAVAVRRRDRRLLAALVALDLGIYARDFHPVVPVGETRESPVWLTPAMTEPGGPRVSVVDRHQPTSLDASLASASLGLLWGTNDVLVPSPLLMLRNDAVLALAGLDLATGGRDKVREYLKNINVARRLGVRWIATVHPVADLVPVVRGAVNLYEDPAALPRARVAPCAEGVGGVEAAFEALPAAPLATHVVLEGVEGGCLAATAGAATIERYADREVTVRAHGPGWLVLADTYAPGWTATVDRAPAIIHRADVLFRAVRLDAGAHEVVFRYDPGLPARLLPMAAVVALAALLAGARWGRRSA